MITVTQCEPFRVVTFTTAPIQSQLLLSDQFQGEPRVRGFCFVAQYWPPFVLMTASSLPSLSMSPMAMPTDPDLVKIFPCSQVGGASYIRALKGPFPDIPLVPTGGVNLDTCAEFIAAGASALGVGGELILKDAIRQRNAELISGLARQMLKTIQTARAARPKA